MAYRLLREFRQAFTRLDTPPFTNRRHPGSDIALLYLRGVSMGDFQEALAALLGRDVPNLSPSVVARLRGEWEAD